LKVTTGQRALSENDDWVSIAKQYFQATSRQAVPGEVFQGSHYSLADVVSLKTLNILCPHFPNKI
jgi:hypothetical protein